MKIKLPKAPSEKTYLKLSIFLVCFTFIYYIQNNDKYFITLNCTFNLLPFIFFLFAATCILSTKVQKGIFTILLLNLLAGPLHLLSHHKLYISTIKSVGMQASHDEEHHDSDVNKNIIPVMKESFFNFFGMGLFWIPFTYLYLDIWICLLWGIGYSSFHNVNQRLWPEVHEYHHVNNNTNLGPDYMDILLHTKGNYYCENMNTGILNIVVTGGTLYSIKHLILQEKPR
jgi:hypothetical protein